MHEKNFDSLKNIKTPQAWLDKATAIPETAVRKRVVPLYRIAAVASIVLVSVIGLLVFLFLGNGKAPIAVSNKGMSVNDAVTEAVVSETTKTGEPVPRETIAVLSTDAQGNTVITYAEATEPQAAGAQSTHGRTAPTERALSPTTSVTPTAPGATEKAAPSPTSSPDHVVATDAPVVPDPPATQPTATQTATQPSKPPADYSYSATFFVGTAGGSGYNTAEDDVNVFCKVYDSAGRLLGDSPAYSPRREATILSKNSDGTVTVSYDPAEKGFIFLQSDAVESGSYVYVFYDIHDKELYRGVKYVG